MKILRDSAISRIINICHIDDELRQYTGLTRLTRLNDQPYILLFMAIDKHIDEIDGYHDLYIGRNHPKHIVHDSEVLI